MCVMSSKVRRTKRRRRRSFGRVFKRVGGPGWLVQFPNPTGRKTASRRTAYITRAVESKREGEQLLKEVRRTILRGEFAVREESSRTDLTLLQAIDEYLGAKRAEGRRPRGIARYETSCRAVAASPIANVPVADLQPRDLEAYQSWRRERKWHARAQAGKRRGSASVVVLREGQCASNSTVNRDIALISAALGRPVRLGPLEPNPVAKPESVR